MRVLGFISPREKKRVGESEEVANFLIVAPLSVFYFPFFFTCLIMVLFSIFISVPHSNGITVLTTQILA